MNDFIDKKLTEEVEKKVIEYANNFRASDERAFLRKALREIAEKTREEIREEVEKRMPNGFVFSQSSSHLDCQDAKSFCRECNGGMMSEARRNAFKEVKDLLK